MTAVYQYHFYDFTTGRYLDTLPVENASFGWQLRSPGTFTGDLPLSSDQLDPARVLAATIPLKTKLFIERGSTLIWGGQLVEPRAYDSASGRVTINASETTGLLAQRFLPDISLTTTDQVTIAEQIVAATQALPYGSLGLIVSSTGLSGYLRDGVYSKWDFSDALAALTALSEQQNGFEFLTQVQWDGSHAPQETLLIAYPRAGRIRSQGACVLEYSNDPGGGGNVDSYQWPDGPGQFTRTWASGTTPDGVTLIGATDSPALAAGYPLIEQRLDYTASSITTQADVQAYASAQAALTGGEVVAATFTVIAAPGVEVGDWQVGDDVFVRITDYRWPAKPGGAPGFADYMRIGAATVTPDQGGREQYSLTMLNYVEAL